MQRHCSLSNPTHNTILSLTPLAVCIAKAQLSASDDTLSNLHINYHNPSALDLRYSPARLQDRTIQLLECICFPEICWTLYLQCPNVHLRWTYPPPTLWPKLSGLITSSLPRAIIPWHSLVTWSAMSLESVSECRSWPYFFTSYGVPYMQLLMLCWLNCHVPHLGWFEGCCLYSTLYWLNKVGKLARIGRSQGFNFITFHFSTFIFFDLEAEEFHFHICSWYNWHVHILYFKEGGWVFHHLSCTIKSFNVGCIGNV